jgi:hypothetical protein
MGRHTFSLVSTSWGKGGRRRYVDDLDPVLEELLGLVGEVVGYAAERGFVGLVDVNALDGAAEGWAVGGAAVFLLAADGMVEDEDAGSARTVWYGKFLSRVDEGMRHVRIFEQLLGLRVVLCLDLLVVNKLLLAAFVLVDLEAVVVEVVVWLVAGDVVDGHVQRLGGAEVCLRAAFKGQH